MTEIEPTVDTVFTEEYWEAPPMPEYSSKRLTGQLRESWRRTHMARDYFHRETISEAEDMLLFAANMLVAREDVTAIEPGEQIGTPDDTTYAIPDAVLLIDRETAFFRPDDYLSQEATDERKDVLLEHELGKSALSAFMSGMTQTEFSKPQPTPEELGLSPVQTIAHKLLEKTFQPKDEGPPPEDYAVLDPFKKHLLEPDRGRYTRVIDLFAFCPNKKGDTASIRMDQWRNPPSGAHVVTYAGGNRWLSPVGFYYTGAVGKTLNVTVNPDFPKYTRIREARLCMPGNLEHAKAPAKTDRRSPATAKQLAADKVSF